MWYQSKKKGEGLSGETIMAFFQLVLGVIILSGLICILYVAHDYYTNGWEEVTEKVESVEVTEEGFVIVTEDTAKVIQGDKLVVVTGDAAGGQELQYEEKDGREKSTSYRLVVSKEAAKELSIDYAKGTGKSLRVIEEGKKD